MNLQDYQKAKEGLLAADLSSRAKWELAGSDRVRYLNGQSTCDVSRLPSGHCTWGAITGIKGKLEGDLHIASAETSLLLDADPALSSHLFQRLSKYIIADDAELTDIHAGWKLYHLLGSEFSCPGIENASGFFSFRSNRFGLPGFDLWLPGKTAFAPSCAEPQVWEAIRIENGLPRWGIDMDSGNLAPEMPFERFGGLSYSKGCYIGQEVIARIKSIGHVNKELCLLHSEKRLTPVLPLPCLHDGTAIGTATSACLSPALGGTCVLATLKRPCCSPGQSIEIDGGLFTVKSI